MKSSNRFSRFWKVLGASACRFTSKYSPATASNESRSAVPFRSLDRLALGAWVNAIRDKPARIIRFLARALQRHVRVGAKLSMDALGWRR
jgi:hypothetical protein